MALTRYPLINIIIAAKKVANPAAPGICSDPIFKAPRVATHITDTFVRLGILNKNLIIDQGGIKPWVGKSSPTRKSGIG